MFRFQPDLRSLQNEKLTQVQFFEKNWDLIQINEADSRIATFFKELCDTYCDDKEAPFLYTSKNKHLANSLFAFCCRDKYDLLHDEWIGIFALPSSESSTPYEVELLWCSSAE